MRAVVEQAVLPEPEVAAASEPQSSRVAPVPETDIATLPAVPVVPPTTEDEGRVYGLSNRDARIVLGAVAPVPYRAMAAEDIIRGKPLDKRQVTMAAEAAFAEANPMSNNAYKIEIAKTLLKRALKN